MSDIQQAQGTIWAVFGHRVAIEGATGRVLADLGPKGAEGLALTVGDTIRISGERKPSEIKVARLTLSDGTTRAFAWDKPDRDRKHHDGKPASEADPALAAKALREAGYHPEGEPKRKPKHFELRGTKDGAAFTVHVDLDGTIRTAKHLEDAGAAAH